VRRRQPTAAELERARQGAREARVAAGLPADAPEDAEYEQRLREREALKKRRR
jgi:hypothetical protein